MRSLLEIVGLILKRLPGRNADANLSRTVVSKSLVVACLLSLAVWVLSASAATVKTVKQSKVLLHLDPGESTDVGDLFNILDNNGTKHAVLLVTATKGRNAIATIQSGEANIGDLAVFDKHTNRVRKPRPKATPEPTPEPTPEATPEATPEPTVTPDATPAAAPTASPTPEPTATPLPKDWNVLGGLSNDTQSVKLTGSSQVSLSGLSFFVRGSKSGKFPEVSKGPLARMAWEAGLGIEEVKTTGSISSGACGGSKDCTFNITAVSPFGRIGYVLSKPMSFQFRIGADLIVPITVSSNVIDYQAFKPLSLLTAGVYMRFGKSEKRRYPVALDYSTYVGNNDVTLTRIMLSAGMSWR